MFEVARSSWNNYTDEDSELPDEANDIDEEALSSDTSYVGTINECE